MIDVNTWMQDFLQTLNETFTNRVWFVGLQGSYGRGEATEMSDIDIVVILDELSAMDIQTYNQLIKFQFIRKQTKIKRTMTFRAS